ncbi:MAG: ATPase, T2SS/T4P/T4SS family, partial [Planctomycetota bacterium]|nr:ATPase, T2SS/T4P/T4SS family [Planctomycetota bacterium]
MPKLDALLVPTDFSPVSRAATKWACDLAAQLGCHVHLLHVSSGGASEDLRRELLQQLHQQVSPEHELHLTIDYDVRLGTPHHEIVDYARQHQIELIVMGTEGRSGLAHFALGSVAERVLRTAPCPVLAVKSDVARESAKILFESVGADRHDEETEPYSAGVELIRRAVSLRATDVHLDPCEKNQVLVRMRIDGRIEEYCRLDTRVASQLIQQLKLASHLDIAEPFLPKEGRVQLPVTMSDSEVRITTCPVADGEAIALRILARDSVFHPLTDLGLSAASLAVARQMLQTDEGILLITGPTGSGKTTTVYSMLEVLSRDQRNIVSIEDPVEFVVPFVRQMSVDVRHGITMTQGLRTLLRMDPDILFLGEIRDSDA